MDQIQTIVTGSFQKINKESNVRKQSKLSLGVTYK